MHKHSVTTMRSPTSFEDETFGISTHRDIVKLLPNKELWFHHPETIKLNEFEAELESLGTVGRFEIYTDSDTLFEVIRGWLVKEDGKRYFFYTQLFDNEIYKSQATGIISALKYSGSSE